MWLSLVERAVWGRQVAGSNPVIPTKESRLMREDSKSKASRLGMAGETAATGVGQWQTASLGYSLRRFDSFHPDERECQHLFATGLTMVERMG